MCKSSLLKMLMLVAFITLNCWLFSVTVYVDVHNVYHDKGNMTIIFVRNGGFGESTSISGITPTVYCCGNQLIEWNNFPYSNCTGTFTVTQGTRSGTSSIVEVYSEMPWTHVDVTLPPIPNYQHRYEQ